MDGERVLLRVWLSPQAKAGLEKWSIGNGISMTGLLEVIGRWCAEHPQPGSWNGDVGETAASFVAQARQFDGARRRRAAGPERRRGERRSGSDRRTPPHGRPTVP